MWLAKEVQRVMDARNWSLQSAEIYTGIPASTINRMKKGLNVKPAAIIQFGIAAGESEQSWGRIALGKAPTPEQEELAKNDKAVHITDMVQTTTLPVIGRVAAGSPVLAEENIDEYVAVPRAWIPRGDSTRCYALVVRGNSMFGADIRDGDVLAVRMVEEAKDGQVVVARIGEKVSVKRLRYIADDDGEEIPYLVSDPEDYMAPIRLDYDDAAIIGIPVGYLRHKPQTWG